MTDDDCVPRADWAERLTAALEGADVVGGRTVSRPRVLDEATQLVVDLVAEREPFFPTMNLACRRELLLAEPFDERFLVSEDREWCARVAATRSQLRVRAPGRGRAPSGAVRAVGFLARHYRYGRGACRYRRVRSGGASRSGRRDSTARFFGGLSPQRGRRSRGRGVAGGDDAPGSHARRSGAREQRLAATVELDAAQLADGRGDVHEPGRA